MKKILITGASGALGHEFIDFLKYSKYELIPTSRNVNDGYYLDVTNYNGILDYLKQSRPEIIIHLAGMVPIPIVEQNQNEAIEVNITGLNNLLKSIELLEFFPCVIVASSSEVYGNGVENRKNLETDPYSPNNLYAYTKVAQEELSNLYMRKGLNIKIARIFNYSSIYKKNIYSLESFAFQIASLIKEKKGKIIVGDLSPKRDFLNGSDVVSALMSIVENNTLNTVFNISRGEATSIEFLLKIMIKEFRIQIEIQNNTNKLRKIENYYVCGDNTRIKSLGWIPKISIEEMVRKLVNKYK